MAERLPSADPPSAVDPADAPPIDLRRALAAFRRSGLIVVALVVAVTAVAYHVASQSDPLYRATARLIVDPTAAAAPADATAVDRELATARSLATSHTVLDAAGRGVPGEPGDPLSESVSARIATPDDVLTITATATEPATAARIANTVAAALIAERARVKHATAVRTRQALSRTLNRVRRAHAARSVLEALRVRLSAAVADEATTGDDLRLVDPAAAPSAPYAPKPARNAALAALTALLIGLLIALARDRLHPRAEDPEGLSRALDLPLVAVFLEPARGARAGRAAQRAAAHLARAVRRAVVHLARAGRWLSVQLATTGRRAAAAAAAALEQQRAKGTAAATGTPSSKPKPKPTSTPTTAKPAAPAIAAGARVVHSVKATGTRLAAPIGHRIRARVGRRAAARQIFAAHSQQAMVVAVRRALPATRRRQRVVVVCGIARRSYAAAVARSLAEGLAGGGLATLLVFTDPASARAARRGPDGEPPDALDVERIGDPSTVDATLARLRRSQYDYVVIAGPALDRGAEIRAVAQHVRAAIVVGRGDRTTMAAAAQARRVLDALGLHGLGVVGTSRRPGAQPEDGLVAVPGGAANSPDTDGVHAGPLSLARAGRSASNGHGERRVAAAVEHRTATND